MRLAMFAAAAVLGLAGPAAAQCDLPAPSPEAAGWQVSQEGGEWVATHPDHPGLEVALFMHSPSRPVVLDWQVPQRYGGRIGVLQHFAGEPGTSHLVTLVHNVLVDLQTGKTLGDGEYSADCELAGWDWQDSRVVVQSAGYGEVVIALP